MGVVFHFAFVLVGTSLQSLGFLLNWLKRLCINWVLLLNWLLICVSIGCGEKFYDMYVVSVFLAHDILDYRVQIYLVVRNHHLRISNPFDKMFVFYFYFVEKMDSFSLRSCGGCKFVWKFTDLGGAIELSQFRDLV